MVGTASWTSVSQVGDLPASPCSSDDVATTMLVVLCADATAIVSFSGLPSIGGLPTDTWLAGVVIGRREPLPGPSLTAVLRRLTSAIEHQFPGEPRHRRQLGLSLLVNGYTWTRRRPDVKRPFQLRLTVDSKYPWHVSRDSAERWILPGRTVSTSLGSGHDGGSTMAVTISSRQDIDVDYPRFAASPWILEDRVLCSPDYLLDSPPPPMVVGMRSIRFRSVSAVVMDSA